MKASLTIVLFCLAFILAILPSSQSNVVGIAGFAQRELSCSRIVVGRPHIPLEGGSVYLFLTLCFDDLHASVSSVCLLSSVFSIYVLFLRRGLISCWALGAWG